MQKIEIINSTRNKKYSLLRPWLIWATSALFVLFQFFLQLSSGVIIEDLMHSFAINAIGAGILSSTYYYVYVALQTPAGILVDRYGPRKLLTAGAVICALGCWLFAVSTHLGIAEFGRLLMGAGSSFAFVGSLYLIGQWFPASKFALMVGIAETVGTIGTILGNVFLATILNKFGWRGSMQGAAIMAIFISFLCCFIIEDRPGQDIQLPETHFFHDALALFKNPKAWFNGIYSGLMFSVVTVFVALWGIPFLVKSHNLSITMATIVDSFLFLGLAVGCPIAGIFGDRLKRKCFLMALCAFLCAILLTVVLLVTSLSLVSTCSLMFLIGLLCSSYVINFTIAKELAPPSALSTSIGFTNSLSVITAPLMQPVVGGLLDFVHHLKSESLGGVENYTLFDYQIALLILPIGLIVAGVIAFFIEDKNKTIKI